MKRLFLSIFLIFLIFAANIICAEESKTLQQNIQKNPGLFLIFDTFVDDYYLVQNYDINCLALEKSVLKNYHDMFVLEKYAKDLPIFITFYGPFLDYISNLKTLYSNLNTKPNYKMTAEELVISKNSLLAEKAIDNKLSQQDKIYILNKIQILPKNLKIDEYPKYKKLVGKIDYSLLNSTDTISLASFLKNLDSSFFVQILTYYNFFWLDDVSLAMVYFNNKSIAKSLDDETYQFTKKDLQTIVDMKKQLLDKAIAFFYSLPQNWNYIAYPYYDPKMDILASNKLSFYMNNLLSDNIDLPSDAAWHIVKSFKSFNSFFKTKMPIGMITDLDFVDENVMKNFAVRDYELIFNKGKFYNYAPVVLNRNSKNIYMLFENVDFYFDNFENIDVLIKNFLNNIKNFSQENMDTIFILNSAKLEKLYGTDNNFDIDEFYTKLFAELKKSCHFVDISSYKNRILNNHPKNMDVASIAASTDTAIAVFKKNKTEYKNKQDINIINIINLEEQDFIINTDSLVGFLDNGKSQNYWSVIKSIKQKVDDKKNKGEIDNKIYNEFMNNIYRIESGVFLGNLDKDKILRKEFDEIVQKIQNIDGFFAANESKNLNVLNNKNGLIQDNKKIQKKEFSKITYFEGNKGFYLEDSVNDDYGDGNYVYPDNPAFSDGTFDLKGLQVFYAQNDIVFKVFMRSLKNPFKSISGFSLPQIDVYIDMNGRKGLGNTMLLTHRNAFTILENAWEYCISINEKGVIIYIAEPDGNIREIKNINFKVDIENNSINRFVPKTVLDGNIFLWNYIVLTCGYDRDKNDVSRVEKVRTKTSFGGRMDDFQSNIIDIILPNNISQTDVLRAKNSIAEIPAVSVKRETR